MEQFRTEYGEAANSKDGYSYEKEREVVKHYAIDGGLELWSNRASSYARGEAPAVQTPIPLFNLKDMMAVHDLKDYGDTDAMVYRNLFGKGCIKLEIEIPDKDGCISKKIYYLDPNDGFNLKGTVKPILIKYSDYLAYKDKFTPWK